MILASVFCLCVSTERAPAICKLARMADLPVTMNGLVPMVTAKINGDEARFVADSGAFFSMISDTSVAKYGLKLTAAPFGFYIEGIGGRENVSVATVKEFTFAGVPFHNVEFIVSGSIGDHPEYVGLLGQNFFRIGDVEYDLANGSIRLMRAEGCDRALLAYWLKPGESYSVMDIQSSTASTPHTTGSALINGAKIRVVFDTGAAVSMLSMRAAARAGVKPDSEGVVDGGYSAGFGPNKVKTYIGRFASFKVGDEEIKNARVRFGQINADVADMLIGADFFLSHHVYVASSQRKLYFTYNGGPVFNLTAAEDNSSIQPTSAAAAGAKDVATETKDADPIAGADAGYYSRRGTAYAARREFALALADLTRACELDPSNADYFYERGCAHRDATQFDLASADFDRAVALNPLHVPAVEARVRLHLAQKDNARATADLDAADKAAPGTSDIRLFLAWGYQQLELLPASISQLDLWIAAHDHDPRLAKAFNDRCWSKAVLNRDLATALSDCNSAIALNGKGGAATAPVFDSRAFVYLRDGEFNKSITDYTASLKLSPKNPWSLYGRGIAELRLNMAAKGEADIAEAVKIWPNIADVFNRRGIAR